MEQNTVATQIDEHLMTIQRDTTSTLNRLESSGLKVDKEFLAHFLKLSFDRLTQTCDRYIAEAKYRMSCTMTSAMTPTLRRENTTLPFSATGKTDDMMEKGNSSTKRKADDMMNASSEVSKKQKTSETIVNNDQSDSTNSKGKNYEEPNHSVFPIGTVSTILNGNVHQEQKPQNKQATTQIELNTNQGEKDGGERLNEPARHSGINSTNELSLITELMAQRKWVTSVYVRGIYRKLRITDRLEIFLEVCKKMGITISRSSIRKINQKSKSIIVELHSADVTNLILEQSRDKFVLSNELFQLSDGKKPWKIYIGEDMTQK